MTLNVGTLSADLNLDDNPFERSLDRAFAKGENRATQIGGAMTKGVTLPLVGAGVAAVKLGVDFDTSMSRIVGLVGLSSDQVGELKTGVMDLAGETAKSPQELADALFTVTSAGFRGSEAMDVLTQAAKASAAGLGETRTIAEALTGAVNAYGPEVLDAASATDILVATARAGNFETSQLAGSLGKVTPFAKQAGASLEDVGGATALLTRVNNNATESITQITALMRAFVVPTQEANKILEELGLTAEDIRTSIGEQGLVKTLQMLDEKLGGNREQLGRLLGSSEAASAAFQILEADAATLEDTFGTVANAAGMTGEAFDAAAGTDGFKMKQAFAELQVALIEAGDMIAPFVATVAGGLSTVAEAFSMLPGPIQSLVVGFAALLAAVGPLMTVGGKIAASWALLSAAFDKAAISAYNASGALGTLALSAAAVTAAVAAIAITVRRYQDEMKETGAEADAMAQRIIGSFDEQGASADELNGRIEFLIDQHNKLTQEGNNASSKFKVEGYHQAAAAVQAEADAMKELRDRAIVLRDELGLTSDEALDMARNEQVMASATDEATGAIDANAAALEAEQQQIQATIDAFIGLADQLRAQFDPLFAAQDATLALGEAQQAAADAAAEFGAESDEAAAANREVVKAALANEEAQIRLRAAIEAGDVSLEEGRATLDRWVAQGAITEEQAAQMAWEFGVAAGKANEIPDSVVSRIGLTGYEESIARLDELARRAGQSLIFNASIRARESAGRHTGGPALDGQTYLVGEYGPELLRMSGSGVIENAGRTEQVLSGASGGSSIDYDKLGRAVAKALASAPAPVVRVSDVTEGLRRSEVARR